MDATAVDAAAMAGAMGATDFSIWSMFLRADWIVKAVIVILLLASIWSWAIIFEKLLSLRRLNRLASEFENAFWSGGALEDLFDRLQDRPRDPMSAIFVAAMREWQRSDTKRFGDMMLSRAGLEERVERVMHLTLAREMGRIERNVNFLASTGATAPFIGLFGTVWGIMNSFQAIGATKNTSLAVVAPGIAEALFATALGLLAAIPAVLAYNKLSKDIDIYAGRLEGFAGEFLAILARQSHEKD
ncbi:MAG: protein TolQ [Rhodospirillales bacterium]|nr:protein TolQ [Rhodospirillales bacterium]